MIRQRMMTKSKFLYKKSIIFFILFLICFSAFSKDWVLASIEFTSKQKDSSKLIAGICETLPQKILEELQFLSARDISADEIAQRKLYELRNQRTSLFLQLSAQIKTRDSLAVSVSSEKELAKKIKEQEQKIKNIETQIDENLKKQKDILNGIYEDQSEYKDFLSKEFISHTGEGVNEVIALYNKDPSILFKPSEKVKNDSYTSSFFEKEVVDANINGLITGHITVYKEYLTVTVEVINYPGAKTICTVKEYGNIYEIEEIARNIGLLLKDSIVNSRPSILKITGLEKECKIYIDNVLQKNTEEINVEAGVHTLEFSQEGYKTIKTSFHFDGNKVYSVSVTMDKETEAIGQLNIVAFLPGTLYAKGIEVPKSEDEIYGIKVNGEKILSQFIFEDGNSAFFYIPATENKENPVYTVKLKSYNNSDYIEKRRRWMYTSYSILVSSLIPYFYIRGQSNSYTMAFNAGYITNIDDWNKANVWITASNISAGVSITCGVWFVYELVRYLYAANNVLPTEAKLE